MGPPPSNSGQTSATVLGVLAVAFWSASIGLNRELTEAFGVVTASAAVYLLAGSLGCAALAWRGELRRALALPRQVLLGQGALFSVYLVSFSLAIGLCRGTVELIEIGLINYLWPGLTLVLSIPVLHNKARWTLVPGLALSLFGVLLAFSPGAPWDVGASLAGMAGRIAANPLPYALCALNVVTWSLYSNLARAAAKRTDVGPTPLFLLGAGLGLAVARLWFPEESHVTGRAVVELVVMAVFPALLSYWFWDKAMRQGHMVLVTSLSYLIPLFSTIITSFLQDLPMTRSTWLACALVIAGAWVCRRSVSEPPIDHNQPAG